MKISEYIQHLERILSEHGDLEVETIVQPEKEHPHE